MLKKRYRLYILLFILLLTYGLGPTPSVPAYELAPAALPASLEALVQFVDEREANTALLKPDNHARIVWANDTLPAKTPYSVVYLHGFSASQREGFPLHRAFAQRYGANLYLSRLQAHGIAGEDALGALTPEGYMASAYEAIEIGQRLGEQVIVMATSTGATQALYLAAQGAPIAAIIAYSPNIEIYDGTAKLLTKPWGYQLGKLATGEYHEFPASEEVENNWTRRYPLTTVVSLQKMLETTMLPETFSSVKQPLFMGYYYKDEEVQDKVVSVERMLEMFAQLGTPEGKKRAVAFPDAGHHCIASDIHSQSLDAVRTETYRFAEEVLGLQPVE